MYETWERLSFHCPDLILYLLRPAIRKNFLNIKPRFNLTSTNHYQQTTDQTSASKYAPNYRLHVSQH